MVWSTALAVALGSGLPVVAAEVKLDRGEGVPSDALDSKDHALSVGLTKPWLADEFPEYRFSTKELYIDKYEVPHDKMVPLTKPRLTDEFPEPRLPTKELYIDKYEVPHDKMAQFQLPRHKREMYRRKGKDPPSPLLRYLEFEYSYGSESEINYRKNPNLNSSVQDDLLLLIPELNGFITYRPTDWLEATLEMILEREIPALEEDRIVLPDGEIQIAPDRKFSLLVDQLYVTIKDFTDPFAITVGRRNFEDDRHWLYDTSLDIASISLKLGKFRAEASVGREVLVDLDLLKTEQRDRINTYMLYTEYRGIEDIKLAGYTVFRDDRAGQEGRPLLMGVRSQGMPSETFSYWIELAHMRGRDDLSRDFLAYAFDVGGTYRFTDLPLNPNVTLGFAFATGDDNGNDSKNNEFRQTGLQSNETRFAGVAEFKTYGEALDPELSNLKMLTVGLGFRPAPNLSVDFVYHHYWLHEIADEIRNSALTAQMNQVDTRLSKDVGSAFDIVVGLRNLFGVRRLGLDLRAGWFFPGKAFLRDEGDEDNPNIRHADKGFAIVGKFWW